MGDGQTAVNTHQDKVCLANIHGGLKFAEEIWLAYKITSNVGSDREIGIYLINNREGRSQYRGSLNSESERCALETVRSRPVYPVPVPSGACGVGGETGLCRRLCAGAQGQRADEVQGEFPLTSRPFWALSPGKRWSPCRDSGDAHLCLDYLGMLREGMERNRPPPRAAWLWSPREKKAPLLWSVVRNRIQMPSPGSSVGPELFLSHHMDVTPCYEIKKWPLGAVAYRCEMTC